MTRKNKKIRTNIPQIEISESDIPSKERIWDKQYQCRDFELSNFWQKSAFLFGFLSLCFAGYGALVLQVVDSGTDKCYLPYIYQYMCGISLLGIVLSVVWIYMMKGSKAWYEVYEKSIYAIEKELFNGKKRKYVEGEFAKEMSKQFNENFTGLHSGAFSPSKINILIGWIMLIVWIICCGISLYNLLIDILSCDEIGEFIRNNRSNVTKFFFLTNCVILCCAILICILKPFVKSGILAKESKRLTNLPYIIIGVILGFVFAGICFDFVILICFAPLIPIAIYWYFHFRHNK
ncbi:MAG: hypothetical protein J6T70_08770 [Bacteroidales bacterium]|nr:hypothetical protein [Bacteroidales bacterium]